MACDSPKSLITNHESQLANQSSPNASSTLPGRPATPPYPELMNSMPPATIGPAASRLAPEALTPFTVVNSLLVSNIQINSPFAVLYARPRPQRSGCGGADQTISPVATRSAFSPPGVGDCMSPTPM